MNVTVSGTGYVGLVTGACLADVGHHVMCMDVDEAKIEGLKNGVIPIYEPGLEPMVTRNFAEGRLRFTKSARIVVGTDSEAAGDRRWACLWSAVLASWADSRQEAGDVGARAQTVHLVEMGIERQQGEAMLQRARSNPHVVRWHGLPLGAQCRIDECVAVGRIGSQCKHIHAGRIQEGGKFGSIPGFAVSCGEAAKQFAQDDRVDEESICMGEDFDNL